MTASTRFEVALASDFPGCDFDLVAFVDCLRDMGDPLGAARHVRQTLKPGGRWTSVEPEPGDLVGMDDLQAHRRKPSCSRARG